ncbi:glucuronyl esterase domain-containing protein [Microlunatus endophyticus]|uniref:glucuronyl esterase domain-containing protein n=1 Tax=Microlunatus endophyticus TaxID=1716077 RepID=UPI00166F00D9|nr:hypothetical protein [Microlunatus endophyticus]
MTIEQTRVIDDFGRYVYGIAPQAEPAVELRALDQPVTLGAGSRSRHELIISTERGRHLVELLLCLPNTDRSPVFSCLNFNGNDDVLATFPIDLLLRNGYGLATVHADAFEPDRADGAAEGVRRILPDPPAEAPWGTIGVWAWGLSVVRRELANLPHIRSDQVIAIGHSRMGKAALWSAAQDQGFAAVISNAAGCSGDSLHTHRAEGTEDIAAITGRFGYWFTPGYADFADRDDELPVDQDELLASIAPRPVYVGSGSEDTWADPDGEFLAVRSARQRNGGSGPVGFHLRPGGHGLTAEDWRHYIAFCNTHVKRP